MIHIVDLSSSDLDAVCLIENLSFGDPWKRDFFEAEFQVESFNYFRGAKMDERLAGYCLFWLFPEDDIQITNIAVHPDFRRRGVATFLLQDAIKSGREKQAQRVILEVRESNLSARSFYEGLGFEQIGRRKRYYEDPIEDALLLGLSLNEAN
ncbi:MAG: ribosomal protein S18-alanine N-acetyltransferase [Candidatus Hinthialibacter antarcticus]|nr:ribosomal protein S18-alanine N-acetyltransferase [Candidatus Hinthialibacter antarcticus]